MKDSCSCGELECPSGCSGCGQCKRVTVDASVSEHRIRVVSCILVKGNSHDLNAVGLAYLPREDKSGSGTRSSYLLKIAGRLHSQNLGKSLSPKTICLGALCGVSGEHLSQGLIFAAWYPAAASQPHDDRLH